MNPVAAYFVACLALAYMIGSYVRYRKTRPKKQDAGGLVEVKGVFEK